MNPNHRGCRCLILLLFCCIANGIYALKIDCQYLDFQIYSCVGTIVLGETVDDIVTELSGEHVSGKSDNDVKLLQLRNQNLTFFPRNMENLFPNLVSINLASNLITNISNRDIKPHKHLHKIDLGSNQITVIESNFFDGLNLRSVIFDRNNIKHVGHNIQLPTDAMLFFSNNPCVDTNAYSTWDVINLQSLLRNQCPSVERDKSDVLNGKVQEVNERAEQNLKALDRELRSKIFELDVALTSLYTRIAALEATRIVPIETRQSS